MCLCITKYYFLPSVLIIEEVSKDANDPANALHEGVLLEFPPALSVVVSVFSEGSLLKIDGACIPPPLSTEAADPDRMEAV